LACLALIRLKGSEKKNVKILFANHRLREQEAHTLGLASSSGRRRVIIGEKCQIGQTPFESVFVKSNVLEN